MIPQPPVVVVSELSMLPIWLDCLIVVVTLLVGHEVGVRLRRRIGRQAERGLSVERVGGNYLGASLGLLALLVAFAFSMAIDRYNTQRELVTQEANAISTAYRLLQTLQEPDRTRLSRAMLPYVDAREAFSIASSASEVRAAEARTDEFQAMLWNEVVGSARSDLPSGKEIFESQNAMYDAATTRRSALESSIPRPLLSALLLYAIISAGLMGYVHPINRRFLMASTIQFFLLSLAFGLILDLDRPRTGLVEVSQAPMLRAVAAVRAAAAAPPAAEVPTAAPFHR